MKTKKFIRSGPQLPVRNLRKTLDFYRDQLGFYEEWTWGDEDGGIRRDDMRLLFAEDPGFKSVINNSENVCRCFGSSIIVMQFFRNSKTVISES